MQNPINFRNGDGPKTVISLSGPSWKMSARRGPYARENTPHAARRARPVDRHPVWRPGPQYNVCTSASRAIWLPRPPFIILKGQTGRSLPFACNRYKFPHGTQFQSRKRVPKIRVRPIKNSPQRVLKGFGVQPCEESLRQTRPKPHSGVLCQWHESHLVPQKIVPNESPTDRASGA